MLSDDERTCFARFAVFAGGATVAAAETITGAGLDTLDLLVAKSLLVRRRHADAPTRLALTAALGTYWLMRARHAEAEYWIDQAVSLPGLGADPAPHVRALCVKARGVWALGRAAERPAILAEAEAVARRLADPLVLFHLLHTRTDHEVGEGRADVAARLAGEALRWATAAGDDWAIAMAACLSANAARDAVELRERVGRAEPLLRAAGNVDYVADLLVAAVYPALCHGSDRDAIDFASRATPLTRDLDNPYLWMQLRGNFAVAALLTGDTDGVAEAFHEELELCRELVVLPLAYEGLNGLAAVATARDDLPRAARLLGAATAHRYGVCDDPVDERLRMRFFEPARTRCPEDQWTAAFHAGATLSFHDAIAHPPAQGHRPPAASVPRRKFVRA